MDRICPDERRLLAFPAIVQATPIPPHAQPVAPEGRAATSPRTSDTRPPGVRWSHIRLPINIAALGLALVGFNQVDVGTLPISDLVFFGVAGVIWLLMLTGRADRLAPSRFRRSSPRILMASVVLVLFGTISSFRSWDPGGSMSAVVRLGYLTMLWFWMLRCLSVNRRAVAVFLAAWRWGVLISAVTVILANAGLFTLGVPNAEGRQTGWFGHPNDLGGYLAISIPLFAMAAPFAATQRRRFRTLWRPVLLGVVVFGMSTAGSMSAFLGGAAGTLAAAVAFLLTGGLAGGRGRATHPLKVAGLVVLGAIGLALLVQSDTPLVQRYTRLGEGDAYVAGSVDSRAAGNEEVINNLDEVLVIGRGLDSLSQQDLDIDIGVHNMYLKLTYEAGLIAAVALGIIILVTLHQGWRLLVNTRSTALHRDIAAVFGAVVAAVVFANFQPTSVQRFYWLPFAMIQCYWALRRAELASGQTEEELNAWADRPIPPRRPLVTPG
jgi:O-antigen ligase